MKHTTIILLLTLVANSCKAQTFAEWFKQKQTQKKYLVQQIAAFQVYLDYVHKGYSMAQKGLTTISNIKKGDFNLHKDFFGSLESVNLKIRNYAKVADIIALQIEIMQVYEDSYKQVRTSSLFTANEVDYIFKVFTNLLSVCASVIDELLTITTDSGLEMKDDERLKRIDALFSSMQDSYTFVLSFGEETKLLAVQRMKEKNNVEATRTLKGIKNK
jgi:hypothetical protein